MSKVGDDILKKELLKKGFELVRVLHWDTESQVRVTAQKLHPVQIKKRVVHVPITVNLTVVFDNESHISQLEGGDVDKKSLADSAQFLKTLVANHQLAGVDDVKPGRATTHSVILNDNGQYVLKRNRFNAY
jgi:hypothetical protein